MIANSQHRLAGLERAPTRNRSRIAAALRAFLQAPAPVGQAAAQQAETQQAGTQQAGTQQAGTQQAGTQQAGTQQAGTQCRADPLLELSFDGAAGRAAGRAPSRAQGYARQIRQLRELQAHPHRLAERFGRAAAPLTAVAPAVSLAMQAKAKTALDFLLQQAPPEPVGWAAEIPVAEIPAAETPAASWAGETPAAETPAAQAARQPSDAELARWGRYVNAVQDPLSALEGLAQGRVPAEAAQTLRTVYPALYGELQRQLFLALTEHLAGGATLSVPQRRALSRVLGVPVDRLTAPDFGQAMQQSFAQERAQQRPQPHAAASRGGRGARRPITLQTPVQRVENR